MRIIPHLRLSFSLSVVIVLGLLCCCTPLSALESPIPQTPEPPGIFMTPEIPLQPASLSADSSEPSLTLHFHFPLPSIAHRISRRVFGETTWTYLATTTNGVSTWKDTNVTVGVDYEYMIQTVINGSVYDKYGNDSGTYLRGGVLVDRSTWRGRVVLLIEQELLTAMPDLVERYEHDLVGDGWTVHRIPTPRANSHSSENKVHEGLRNSIKNLALTYPGELKAVTILGNVALPRTGISPDPGDGHSTDGASGVDAYYAELDETWSDSTVDNTFLSYSAAGTNVPGDGKYDYDEMEQLRGNDSKLVDLGYGRMDWFQMGSGEHHYLRHYLDKIHRYRHATPDFRPGTRVFFRKGYTPVNENFWTSGMALGRIEDVMATTGVSTATDGLSGDRDQDWSEAAGPFLWHFRGNGAPVLGMDPAAGKSVFHSGFQSYWGRWWENAMIVRATAGENFALGYTWEVRGRYMNFLMGNGATAGEMIRTSINNFSEPDSYPIKAGQGAGGVVFMNWMGDPMLRGYMFEPAENLQVARSGSGSVILNWTASPAERVLGYHVYRSSSFSEPFQRLTAQPISSLNYTDADPGSSGNAVYQVRAVRVDQIASGSFINASQGIFATLDLTQPPGLTLQSISLPPAAFDTDYSANLNDLALANENTLTWEITSGSLPEGVELSPSGILAGIPLASGNFSLTLRATNAAGYTASQSIALAVSSFSKRTLRATENNRIDLTNPSSVAPPDRIISARSTNPVYFKFPTQGLAGATLQSAKIRLAVGQRNDVFQGNYLGSNNLALPGTPTRVHWVSNDSWSATSLTANNAPSADPTVSAITQNLSSTGDFWQEWDVTSLLQAEINRADSSNAFSVRLEADGIIRIQSLDAGYGYIAPQLVVEFAPPAASLELLSPKQDPLFVFANQGVELVAALSHPTANLSSATHTWSVVAAPVGATVTFADPQALSTHASFSQSGVYQLQISASFNGHTTSRQLQITVGDDAAGSALPRPEVAWFPFNETANSTHAHNYASGANVPLTNLSPSTAWGSDDGVAGGYLNLAADSGGIGHLNLGNTMNFSSGQPFTISFWYRSNQYTGTFLSKRFTDQNELWIRTSYGDRLERWVGDSGSLAQAIRPMSGNQWRHVIVSGDPAFHMVRVLIDGGEGGGHIGGSFGTLTTAADLLVGASRGADNSTLAEDFDGAIDELRIYNRALPADELRNLYLNTAAPQLPRITLVASAPFVGAGTATLRASVSGIPSHENATFQWEQISGTPVSSLSNATSLQASAQLPAAGTYGFRLHVRTAGGNTFKDILVSTSTGSSLLVSQSILQLQAGGDPATFQVQLNAAPTSNVVINLAISQPDAFTASPNSLTFTPANWNAPQTVTVSPSPSGGNALPAELSLSVDAALSAPGFVGAPPAIVLVNITTTTKGILTRVLNTQLPEGSSEYALSVRLSQPPTGSVSVSATSSDPSRLLAAPQTIVFTPSNYAVEQWVRLDTLADNDFANNSATVTLAVSQALSDPAYAAATTRERVFTLLDESSPRFGLFVPDVAQVPEGTSIQIPVSVEGSLTGQVVIQATLSGAGVFSRSPATLTFTPGNIGSPQNITVTVANDSVLQNLDATLTLSVVPGSSDPTWAGLSPHVITLQSKDNDNPGRIVYAGGVTDLLVREGDGIVTIQVERVEGTAGTLTVTPKRFFGGTFDEPTDWFFVIANEASRRLTWADGEAGIKSFQINVVNDAEKERAEQIDIRLGDATGVYAAGQANLTVRAFDNDGSPYGGGDYPHQVFGPTFGHFNLDGHTVRIVHTSNNPATQSFNLYHNVATRFRNDMSDATPVTFASNTDGVFIDFTGTNMALTTRWEGTKTGVYLNAVGTITHTTADTVLPDNEFDLTALLGRYRIAFAWLALDHLSGGQVAYKIVNFPGYERLVVRFTDVPTVADPAHRVNVEVEVFKNGIYTFTYLGTDIADERMVIGMSQGEGGTSAYPTFFSKQATFIPAANARDIIVSAQNVLIASGDTTPSPADNTDFGTQSTQRAAYRTFRLHNLGEAPLTLSVPSITLTGSSAFSVLEQPAQTTLGVNEFFDFTVAMQTQTLGTHNATVHVHSNDPTQADYTFALQAQIRQSYALNYYAAPNGTLLGELNQDVIVNLNGSPVTAQPNTGYRFVEWTDHRTDNPRTDTNVTQNLNVGAVFAANTPPIPSTYTVNVTMSEDGSPTPFTLPLTGSDPDGDSLVWSLGSSSVHGIASASGTGLSPVVSYTPTPDWFGTDSFTILLLDRYDMEAAGGAITVNVVVEPVNDAPVLNGSLPAQTATLNQLFNYTVASNLFSDKEGETISYSARQADGTALPAWLNFDPATLKFTGTPGTSDIRQWNLHIVATDASAAWTVAPLSIIVSGLADITVYNGNDSGPGSLRAAVAIALDNQTIDFAGDVTLVTLTSGEILIDKPITIHAYSNVTISGNNNSRIFRVNSVLGNKTITLNNLTLTNGNGVSTVYSGKGGALYLHRDHLIMQNCIVQNSTATSDGGGICAPDATNSSLTITNSTISGNTASTNGGGIYSMGRCTLTNVTISGNTATGGYGGGFGNLFSPSYTNTFTDCSFTGNTAGTTGGGVTVDRKPTTMLRCVISGNTSAQNGGGVNLACSGENFLIDCTIADNTISEGSTRYGGGMAVSNTGSATLLRTTISGNKNLSNGGDGGGFYSSCGGEVSLVDSTLSGNTSTDDGAGVHMNSSSGYLALRNCTITANTGDQGDGIWVQSGTVDLLNTIISGNGNEDIRGSIRRAERCLYGNSVTAPATAIANLVGQSPLLAPLSNNGGLTKTHLPGAGSPAIDAGTTVGVASVNDRYAQLVAATAISGIAVGVNTDSDAFLHGSIVDTTGAGTTYRVNLYKDAARTLLVAHSANFTKNTGEQTLALTADNASGLGGSITVNSNFTPTLEFMLVTGISNIGNITGAIGNNTDANGMLWITTTKDTGNTTLKVDFYKSSAKITGNLVAHTGYTANGAAAALVADNASGLGGSVTITNTGFSSAGYAKMTPASNEIRIYAGVHDQRGNGFARIVGTASDIGAVEVQATYTVTYHANTGTGSAPVDNAAYASGATVTVLGADSLAKNGARFSGWNTAADSSGTNYAPGATFSMPAAAVTLYAQWTALSPYETWLTNYPALGGTNALSTADPDADGIPNLIEYALGGNPTASSPANLLEFGTSANHITLRFTPSVVAGLTYTIEASSDLSVWSPKSDITSLLTPGHPYTFTDSSDLGSTPRRFLRLRVTVP